MPKENIDYSNTIIYKIYCNDKCMNDVYVGHTTNFTKRKYLHKSACSNLNNKLKIYRTIREHGGWDNWNMIEIATYNCKDKTEARIKEQQHYNELNSSLNSCPPYTYKNIFFCSMCNINCISKNVYETHINCSLHKKIIQIDTKKMPKNAEKIICEICDFKCCKQSNFDKHITTPKHKNNEKRYKMVKKNADEDFNEIEQIFACDCGNIYKHYSGLWRHKKTCKNENKKEEENITIEPDINDKKLMLTLIQQNNELQKQMLDVIKNGTINNTINNNNSHNKTFNLQLFLNETCKDAMNIMDFVDSIKIQLCDIESIGELGFVNGMSKLIIKNLNALAENMRPVHCNDPKRDSLYVKDANVWEKEDIDNKKIKKAIKYISHKNICAIPQWKAKYPDCIYSDSKKSDQYNHIVVEAMGGSGDNDAEKADKIVKKIAREVTIDKNN
jgi:hypothetical protein